MAENEAQDNKPNEVDNAGPAVPSDGGSQVPQAGAAPGSESTPQPAATTQAEPGPAGGEANPEDAEIRNPEAFYKAQAEKFQRLHSKTEEQLKAMELKLKERDDEDAVQIREQMTTLQQELEAERQRTRQAELDAMRIRIGSQHNLDPELAARLQGETEEAIAEDAARLAKLIPQSGRKANVGNPSGNQSSNPLTRNQPDAFSGQ